MNKVALFHHHFCLLGLICGIKGCMQMKAEHKTDHIIIVPSLSNWNRVMESGGVIWTGACSVAWNVECAM